MEGTSLQAIVDGWSSTTQSAQPITRDQRAVLQKLLKSGIRPTSYEVIDRIDKKLQTAIELSLRNPPLAVLIADVYVLTKEGYGALVPEREVISKLILGLRWTARSGSEAVRIEHIVGLRNLPPGLIEEYVGALKGQGLVSSETVADALGEHEVVALTDLGQKLAKYLIELR